MNRNWFTFLKSTNKNNSTNRFKAKCSYCHKILDGKPALFPKHILIDCPLTTPTQKSEYTTFVSDEKMNKLIDVCSDITSQSDLQSDILTATEINKKRKIGNNEFTPLQFIPFSEKKTQVSF